MHNKGMRTLKVLSDLLLDKAMDDINLNMSRQQVLNNLDFPYNMNESLVLKQGNNNVKVSSGQVDLSSSLKRGIIGKKSYQNADSTTVIKVLLRCKLLYTAMGELKKLL